MNKNVKILFALLIVSLVSCHHFDDKIVKKLNSLDIDDTIVDLQDVLGFKYDSLYVFTEFTNTRIPLVLGDVYSNRREIADSHKRVFLFYQGEIIYEDDYPTTKMYIYPITERLDTNEVGTYIVHYGSHYKVKTHADKYHGKYYELFREKDCHELYEYYLEEGLDSWRKYEN